MKTYKLQSAEKRPNAMVSVVEIFDSLHSAQNWISNYVAQHANAHRRYEIHEIEVDQNTIGVEYDRLPWAKDVVLQAETANGPWHYNLQP